MPKRSTWSSELPFGLPSDFDWSLIETPDDADTLISTLPNRDRGNAAAALYVHPVDHSVAYRGMMASWDHDHAVTIDAFGSQEEFASALREVAPVRRRPRRRAMRCWRGIAVETANPVDAAFGVSWTTNRDVACWFAFQFVGGPDEQPDLRPFVFRCDIDPDAILVVHNDRDEREVLVDPSRLWGERIYVEGTDWHCGQLDPDSRAPNDLLAIWRDAAQRLSRRRRSREMQRLRKLRLQWRRAHAKGQGG